MSEAQSDIPVDFKTFVLLAAAAGLVYEEAAKDAVRKITELERPKFPQLARSLLELCDISLTPEFRAAIEPYLVGWANVLQKVTAVPADAASDGHAERTHALEKALGKLCSSVFTVGLLPAQEDGDRVAMADKVALSGMPELLADQRIRPLLRAWVANETEEDTRFPPVLWAIALQVQGALVGGSDHVPDGSPAGKTVAELLGAPLRSLVFERGFLAATAKEDTSFIGTAMVITFSFLERPNNGLFLSALAAALAGKQRYLRKGDATGARRYEETVRGAFAVLMQSWSVTSEGGEPVRERFWEEADRMSLIADRPEFTLAPDGIGCTSTLLAGVAVVPTRFCVDDAAALLVAVQYRQLECARTLLERLSVELRDSAGKTLLHLAAESDSHEIAELLIARGAAIDAKDDAGFTPLHRAAMDDSCRTARLLIATGADVHAAAGEYAVQPLSVAAANGHKEMAELLLGAGAEVNRTDRDGDTPVDWALNCKHPDLASYLRERGGASGRATRVSNARPLSPPPIAAAATDLAEVTRVLMAAVRKDDLEVCRSMLRNQPDLLGGENLLITVVATGSREALEVFLDAGAEVNGSDNNGVTALIFACGGTGKLYRKQALLLLDRGADVNIAVVNGFTPLMYTAKLGDIELLEALIQKGADVNAISRDGDDITALSLAAGLEREDAALLLLDRGADPWARSKDNFTALMSAAKHDLRRLAARLTDERTLGARGNLELATDAGWTPLHMAAHFGHTEIARLLLARGANPNTLCCNGPPIVLAVMNGGLAVMELLLAHGANPNAIWEENEVKVTPLTFAIMRKDVEAVRVLVSHGGSMDLATGVQPRSTPESEKEEARDAERLAGHVAELEQLFRISVSAGASCGQLFLAIAVGNVAEVRTALDASPSSDLNAYGYLHFAVMGRHVEIARYLIDKGASVNARTAEDMTPLFWSAKSVDVACAALLLDKGANPNIPNVHGLTPLIVVLKPAEDAPEETPEMVEFVRLLLAKGADTSVAIRGTGIRALDRCWSELRGDSPGTLLKDRAAADDEEFDTRRARKQPEAKATNLRANEPPQESAVLRPDLDVDLDDEDDVQGSGSKADRTARKQLQLAVINAVKNYSFDQYTQAVLLACAESLAEEHGYLAIPEGLLGSALDREHKQLLHREFPRDSRADGARVLRESFENCAMIVLTDAEYDARKAEFDARLIQRKAREDRKEAQRAADEAQRVAKEKVAAETRQQARASASTKLRRRIVIGGTLSLLGVVALVFGIWVTKKKPADALESYGEKQATLADEKAKAKALVTATKDARQESPIGPTVTTAGRSAATTPLATARADPKPASISGSPRTLIAIAHEALESGDPGALAPLISASAFGFGLEARDRASSGDAIVAMLRRELGSSPVGFRVSSSFLHVGSEGKSAWIAEEIVIAAREGAATSRRVMMTIAAQEIGGRWEIRAMHWALPMDNAVAIQRARDGQLTQPASIEDKRNDAGLALAFREAFGSRQAFVDTTSMRADAFNFGSAPGERMTSGPVIKRVFGNMDAEIKIHDGVKVATMSDGVGWGAANVDFTVTRGGSVVTEVYRVLAVLVREGGSWRIVQAQWSNGT